MLLCLEPYKMFMLLCAYYICVTCVLNFCSLLTVTALLYHCMDFRPGVSAVHSLPVP